MHQLIIEQRTQTGSGISGDLAKHLYGRMLRGKVVVVCERPAGFMSAVRKQWLKVCRQVQRERASTLQTTHLLELTHALTYMQSLRFSARPPEEELSTDVSFATPAQLLAWAPVCHTMYVTCEVTKEDLYRITAWMVRGGLVVIYGNP